MSRFSRSELTSRRSGVQLLFNAPTDGEITKVVDAFEWIQGRRASTRQQNYLIRIYRIHGPATVPLLERLFREHGTAENLLALVETYPPDGVAANLVEDDTLPFSIV